MIIPHYVNIAIKNLAAYRLQVFSNHTLVHDIIIKRGVLSACICNSRLWPLLSTGRFGW